MEDSKGKTTPTPSDDLTDHLPRRVRLQSASDIFALMAKITRLCATGRMAESRYKALVYGLHNLLSAHEARQIEKESWGNGDGGPKPLYSILSFPDSSTEALFEFYQSFWWMPHVLTNPPCPSESHHGYLKRLREELGINDDPTHILGYKFQPVTDPVKIEKILAGMRDANPDEDGESPEAD